MDATSVRRERQRKWKFIDCLNIFQFLIFLFSFTKWLKEEFISINFSISIFFYSKFIFYCDIWVFLFYFILRWSVRLFFLFFPTHIFLQIFSFLFIRYTKQQEFFCLVRSTEIDFIYHHITHESLHKSTKNTLSLRRTIEAQNNFFVLFKNSQSTFTNDLKKRVHKKLQPITLNDRTWLTISSITIVSNSTFLSIFILWNILPFTCERAKEKWE